MEYKYDLAISLLDEDADIAAQIINKFDRPEKIFFYKKEANELTFADGLHKFKKVFFEESRFILLLHREKYGATNWTAVENSIIQERFLTTIKNKDHSIFLCKLDNSPVPYWWPATYIYHSFTDVDSLVDLIKNKIGGSDLISFQDNTEEQLRLASIEKNYEETFSRKAFHDFDLAEESRSEAENLRDKLFDKIKRNAQENHLRFTDNSTQIYSNISIASLNIRISNAVIYLIEEPEATNAIEKARLRVIIYEIPNNDRNRFHDSEPVKIKDFEKCYFRTINNIQGWRDPNKKNFLSTDEFIEEIFRCVVKIIVKA